jgi:preprotein translocase subunit SecD
MSKINAFKSTRNARRLGEKRWIFGVFAILLAGASILTCNYTWAQGRSEAMSKPGAHLVLALDADEVRTYWLTSMRDEIRGQLREAKVGFGGLALVDNVMQVRLSNPEDADRAVRALGDLALIAPIGLLERTLAVVRGSLESGVTVAKSESGIVTISPTERGLERRMSEALDDTLAIVTRRLDGMGLLASAVRRARDEIYVHAPSLQDTGALKELLTKPARLGFHEVHAAIGGVEQARQGRAPMGFRIYPAMPGELLLREIPVVKGSDLADAHAAFDQRTHEPVIAFRFNQTGAHAFSKFTAANVGRPFAIVLDNVVLSAPVIRDAILGGRGQVSGNFTVGDAKQLAVQLRAGTLPAKLSVVMERVVPAS